MEDLRETLCSSYGLSWPYKRVFGFSQLPSAAHVQIHQGKHQISWLIVFLNSTIRLSFSRIDSFM